jgi:hypothetical protein
MNATLSQKLRYRFDNLMARGAVSQMFLLGTITLAAIFVLSLFVQLGGIAPESEEGTPGFPMLMWLGLMHTLDSGMLGGDSGSRFYLFLMSINTLVGIFVLSALIGILNSGLEGVLDGLRKGKSLVVEKTIR